MKRLACLGAVLLCSLGLTAAEFAHDLHYYCLPGTTAKTVICLHGYGDNYNLAKRIREHTGLCDTLISFNFPDYDICETDDHELCSYGTLGEILPAIHVLKKCIIEEGRTKITLYGMSAGGGALINVLAALYNNQDVGLTPGERAAIIAALESGTIILDVPLKSVDEIIAYRKGANLPFKIIAKRHKDNNMCPIEVLKTLKNLKLNIIVYFVQPDTVLSNRDDALYVKRLKEANSRGKTTLIYGRSGSHGGCHDVLWKYYMKASK